MLNLTTCAVAACTGLLVPLAWYWLQAAARRLHQAHELVVRRELADLFVFIEPGSLARTSAATMVVVLALAVLAGMPHWLWVSAGLTVLLVPGIVLRWLKASRHRRLVRQLPDAMVLLAAALRSGQGLVQAFGQLAEHQSPPISQEFQLLVRKHRLGMPFDRAMSELCERAPVSDYALFATAVRVAREMGGNLAETLERLAESQRRRLAMEDKIRSLTAQGKLQGWIVGLLPVLLLVVLLGMEPVTMRELFVRPMGWCALAVMLILELAGFFIIRRIVRIDV